MKNVFKILAASGTMLFASCNKDTAAFQLPENLYTVDKVYDIGNSGDASDIRVEISALSSLESSNLVDVRLVITKPAVTLTAAQIGGLATGNFYSIPVSNMKKQVIKPSGAKDSEGDAITTGVAYKIYVAIIGKEDTRQLSASKNLTLVDKPIFAGDYIGTWEDLGPPGPGEFPMSLRIANDYSGSMFYANATFTPYGAGSQDATTTMTVSGVTISSFVLNQFINGYSGSPSAPGYNQTPNCPATQTITGRFEDDVNLVLDTFNWSDCDGTRDVRLRFTRQ